MTNKVALRTVEEFMSGYTAIYQPIYSLFLGKSQAYSEQVGTVDFKRADTVGDIRLKHITPKDTEMKQVAVGEGKKTLKKYFLGIQYIQSTLQDNQGIEDVLAQVLDENQKLADEIFLLGEGSAANNVVNNGLYWSGDANYQLENSKEIDKGTAADHLKDMHTQIMVTASVADQIAGRKVLIVYGADATAKFDSLYANTDAPFKSVLKEVLGENWSLVKLPADVTPSGANGWMAVNLDQVKLHYTAMPKLDDQGFNAEKKYTWHNFLMGSMMLEVLVKKAIIRQPVTFEA